MKHRAHRKGIDETGLQVAETAHREHVVNNVAQKFWGIFDLLGEGNRLPAITLAGQEILLGIAGGADGPTVRFAVIVHTDESEVATLARIIGRARFLGSVGCPTRGLVICFHSGTS